MKIVLLRGDGIGPEISESVVKIVSKLKLPIEWVDIPCGLDVLQKEGSVIPKKAFELIQEFGVAIKGPTTTPIGTGHRSANVALRKELDLYANVRPVFKLPGVKTPFENVDLIIVRENTEDVYMGLEHRVLPDVAQCIKTITARGCRRISKFAFDWARKQNRKSVNCIHKANIMKMTDGLFLEVYEDVAKLYPEIEAKNMLVDNACMQLVRKPEQFDVIVTENLYGDILSDLCAGLVGGLGVAGGANIGDRCAVFEAVHGSAPDIAGKGIANPTAMILSTVMLLDYLNFNAESKKLKDALFKLYADGRSITQDLGGHASTADFTEALGKFL